MRKRSPRRLSIDIEALCKADDTVRLFHEDCVAKGYFVAGSSRLRRRKDGSFTARVVWRHRDHDVRTIALTTGGFVIA